MGNTLTVDTSAGQLFGVDVNTLVDNYDPKNPPVNTAQLVVEGNNAGNTDKKNNIKLIMLVAIVVLIILALVLNNK